MRRTVLALLAATAMVAGCQQPAEVPASAPGETVAPVPAPEMPVDAPPQEEVDPAVAAGPAGSCLAEIGAGPAAKLVERCVMVSPATHPPCNVANPCAMIQGEIDRSCAMYGPDETRPSQCGA